MSEHETARLPGTVSFVNRRSRCSLAGAAAGRILPWQWRMTRYVRSCCAAGFVLEYTTLGWNVAGIVVLAIAAISARSVALAGFALDSLIEIGASTVVIWELSGTGEQRQRRGLRLIGYAFAALALYLLVQSTVVLAAGDHPRHSVPGIIWTALTAVVMFALAAGKARTGRALGNPVLQTEGRVTLVDGILATAVLAGPGAERRAGMVVGRPGGRVRAGLLRRPGGPGDLLHRPVRSAGARAARSSRSDCPPRAAAGPARRPLAGLSRRRPGRAGPDPPSLRSPPAGSARSTGPGRGHAAHQAPTRPPTPPW